MAKVQFELGKVSAALAAINHANGDSTGPVDITPAQECGVMFKALANGSFDVLTSADQSRLRHAATAIGRSYRSEQGLKTLLDELGTDLLKVGSLRDDSRRRARIFLNNAVTYRS